MPKHPMPSPYRERNKPKRPKGVGGKMKHAIRYLDGTGGFKMKPARTLDGRPVPEDARFTFPLPYMGRATGPRPWDVRNKNRKRNKRARASRKANR
jgi:hypothetical protein